MLPSSPHLQDALTCLRQGQILAYPTEGVYGLGCDARDGDRCERVIQLKQRRPEQGMIVLVDCWSRVADWIQPLTIDQQQHLDGEKDAFVTWLLPASHQAPPWLTGGHDTLAVRRPVWQPLLTLCRAFAAPLLSTSANPHGQPATDNVDTVQTYFKQGVDLIWDHPCGGWGRASSIICLRSGKQLR